MSAHYGPRVVMFAFNASNLDACRALKAAHAAFEQVDADVGFTTSFSPKRAEIDYEPLTAEQAEAFVDALMDGRARAGLA